MKIDDIILNKCLGKGESEVYLASKENDSTNLIVKRYDRINIENTEFMYLLRQEIIILQKLEHPNIIHYINLMKTRRHFYIIFEYCNGGNLSNILDKYQQEFGKPFSQEIIQHLMRQIIDAVKYIHTLKIVHNNINLNYILIHYKDENDEEEFNLLKSNVKIIGFKHWGRILSLKESYLDIDAKKPICTEKDLKNDILQLGKLCFKMLFGKYALDDNIDNMEKIIDEIENGKYNYPITLSKEIISFLKDMLRKDPDKRLNIYELLNHDFIIKNIKDFQLINEQKEEEQKEKKHLCVICLTNNQEIILSPCGHKCICENCYYKLKYKNQISECPICWHPVESIARKVFEV